MIDTPGFEKLRLTYQNYYKEANIIFLVYDITNEKSFIECENYFNDKIKEKCNNDVKVVLLGNKNDLENERKVSYEKGKQFSQLNNYSYHEISCLKYDKIISILENMII